MTASISAAGPSTPGQGWTTRRYTRLCAAIHAKDDAIPLDGDSYTDINQVWQETEATPVDVPFHPGALQWYKEHGVKL